MNKYILTLFSLLFLGTKSASAHVAYVVPEEILKSNGGADFSFLFSPFLSLNYTILVICIILIIIFLYYLAHHIPSIVKEISFVKNRLLGYQDLIPWILRLGLGLLLIGSALNNVFISPVVNDIASIAPIELIIGFFLLLGLFVTPSLLILIGFYLSGLFFNGYLFGNMEILGSAVALILLANSKPGIDDILGIPTLIRNKFSHFVPLVLRLSLGGSLIFLAFYEKIFNPRFFALVVEQYHLTSIIPVTPAMWTLGVGLVELILGLFIFLGFKTRITSAITFFVLCSTFFLFKEDVYSHVTIFAVLSALFVMGSGPMSIDEHIEHENMPKRKSTKLAGSGKKSTRKTKPKSKVKKTIARKKKVSTES